MPPSNSGQSTTAAESHGRSHPARARGVDQKITDAIDIGVQAERDDEDDAGPAGALAPAD